MNLEQIKMNCACGGKMKPINTTWKHIPVRGWKCAKCSEELIHPADAQKALEMERAKKRNLLVVKLRKVGKSNVVTIPQPIIDAEHLKAGQTFEWSIETGKLVLRTASGE